MKFYPKGTGAGISLFILIAIGIYAISQIEAMKRAAFREGFSCAIDATTPSLHSSFSCKDYRKTIHEKSNR